jgi:flagellin
VDLRAPIARNSEEDDFSVALRIQTNTISQNAQRHLGYARGTESAALEKLASGSRINRAGDDAAGLAISEKLRAKGRSLRQDVRNASDSVSLIQVAEGAMNEASNILIRLRELSIQGASDTIGDEERGYLDKEAQALHQELSRISKSTEYNGVKVLADQPAILEFQVGPDNNPENDRMYFDALMASVSPERLQLDGISMATKESSRTQLTRIDLSLKNLSEGRAMLGALQNRIASAINNLNIYSENIAGANSRIRDTDMAEQTSELTRANIQTQSGISVISQANQNAKLALKLLG